MINQNSCRFYDDIVYDDYRGLVLDKDEGDHMASAYSPYVTGADTAQHLQL